MPPKRSRTETAPQFLPASETDTSDDENMYAYDHQQDRVNTFFELPAQDLLSQIAGIATRLAAAIVAIRPAYGGRENGRMATIRVLTQAMQCVHPAATDLKALTFVLAAQLDLYADDAEPQPIAEGKSSPPPQSCSNTHPPHPQTPIRARRQLALHELGLAQDDFANERSLDNKLQLFNVSQRRTHTYSGDLLLRRHFLRCACIVRSTTALPQCEQQDATGLQQQ